MIKLCFLGAVRPLFHLLPFNLTPCIHLGLLFHRSITGRITGKGKDYKLGEYWRINLELTFNTLWRALHLLSWKLFSECSLADVDWKIWRLYSDIILADACVCVCAFPLYATTCHVFLAKRASILFCSVVCASACANTSQYLFLWLSQALPALQTQWRWRRWQTVQPSWRGAPAETTAAPSPITSFKPELPSLWVGRGLTQVTQYLTINFHLIAHEILFR